METKTRLNVTRAGLLGSARLGVGPAVALGVALVLSIGPAASQGLGLGGGGISADVSIGGDTGIDADVIDLRWLDRDSVDWDTIGASVRKTNSVLLVEQGAQGTSYGAWLADEIQRRYFDWLDQPVHRVTGGEASPSISRVLERAAIARTEEVVIGLHQLIAGIGKVR